MTDAVEFVALDGLPDKEYNQFIDAYLSGQPIHVETYERMNVGQKKVVQIIKRAFARIKSRKI